jgi:hypothetical protein
MEAAELRARLRLDPAGSKLRVIRSPENADKSMALLDTNAQPFIFGV